MGKKALITFLPFFWTSFIAGIKSASPETIIARHCGLKVASVSAVTNMAAGMSDEILSHEGTLKGATLATENMIKLFLLLAEEFGK